MSRLRVDKKEPPKRIVLAIRHLINNKNKNNMPPKPSPISPHSPNGGGNGGGGGPSGGGGGGGGGDAPAVLINYRESSRERNSTLPPQQQEAKMLAESQMADNRAHLELEKSAVRLQRLTQLMAFEQASNLYYKLGGTQSLTSRINPKAILDIDMEMEGKTGAPHNFAGLTEKAQLALYQVLLKSRQSTSASFEAAVQAIAQTGKFFDMELHKDYLGDHRELQMVKFPDIWCVLSKEAQLRSLVSGFSPLGFRDAVTRALKQVAFADYHAGLVIIQKEADEEQIRTHRNAAAKKLTPHAPSPPRESQIPPKASLKAPPAAVDESDDDDVSYPRKSASLASTVPKTCPCCLKAGRNAKHHLQECIYKCCHDLCATKRPHLAVDCPQWLPSSMRDKSPPPRREQHRRDRRANDYDDDQFERAQDARLAIANRNARKANLARLEAAAYASDTDENATYDTDDPEISAARLYAHSVTVRGNSARIREEPSRASAEYAIDRAHRADLAARFGYTPPSSDYDSEADGEN